MNRIWRLLAILSVLLCISCEKDDLKPEDISIQLVSDSTVYTVTGQDMELVYQITPNNLLSREDVTVFFSDERGRYESDVQIVDMKDGGNGKWTIVSALKYEDLLRRDVCLAVTFKEQTILSEITIIKRLVAKITSITIGGKVAKLDQSTNSYSAVLPGVTDFSDVIVTTTFQGESLTDGKNTYTSSGNIHADLTQPLKLTVSMGTLSNEYTISAKNTGLPVVRVDTPGNKAITSKEVWMEGASIRIENADGSVDCEGSMSIRGRGNSTWNYVKKPYAIKLDSKASVLGMPKHKRWILLANWKDRTIMRNDAAFWLGKQTSLPYTVRGQFVELVLNGKHMGNYYLCEQIKIDKNRVNIKEMDPMETDPEKITGGFLMELDTYFDEINKFTSPKFNLPYMFKQPDETELSPEAKNYFINYITELETLLKDEARVKNHEYEEYMDVDSAIEYMLVEELTNNTDFYNTWPSDGPHSCYLYKDRGGKLFHGPLWDFDYHGFVPNLSYMWAGAKKTLYYPALYKDPKFKNRMLEIWNDEKTKFEGLTDYIDKTAEYIRLSEEINHEMWPITTNFENGDESMTFNDAVERIKKGFKEKLKWMDQHINELN